MSPKVDRKKVGTASAATIIIVILVFSSLNNITDPTSEPVPYFELGCDRENAFSGQIVTCVIQNQRNAEAFIWNFHDNSPLETKLPDEDVVQHRFNQSGTYQISVVAYNTNNLTTIASLSITVLEPFPDLAISANTSSVYEDEPIEFTVSNTPLDQEFSYRWEFGDQQSKTGTAVTHSYSFSGDYIVRFVATTESGLTQTEFLNISVHNFIPQAEIQTNIAYNGTLISGNHITEGSTVLFNASNSIDSQSDVADLEFLWNFQDGSYSNLPVVNHTFTDEGNYDVSLKVFDDDGNSTTTTQRIIVSNTAPQINSLQASSLQVNEGETVILQSNVFDTNPDLSNLHYNWSLGTAGWLTTYSAIDDFSQNIGLEVTDDNGLSDYQDLTIESNNVAPIPSLKQIFAEYNVTFAIMGEKWHNVNITLYDNDAEMLSAYLVRQAGEPWENNATFAFLRHDLRDAWKFEVLYTPEDDPVNGNENGANPVDAVMYFGDTNDNYTVEHTFNVQQVDSYNWTFYINPLQWGFPLDLYYHVFDPGKDNITIVTDFGGEMFETSFNNNGKTYTEGDIVARVRKTNITSNVDSLSLNYHAFDDDGGISETYSLPLTTLINSEVGNVTTIDLYAPVFYLDTKSKAIEDQLLSFKTMYLTPEFSNDSSSLDYYWHLGDLMTSNSEKLTHFYEHEGNYLVWVEVRNSRFSYATGRIIEVANQQPEASIAPLPVTIIEDQSLDFDVVGIQDSLSDRFNLTYFWQFSNGFSSSSKSFEYAFAKSGHYTINLTVSDDQGSTTFEEVEIYIDNSDPLVIHGFNERVVLEGQSLDLFAEYSDSMVDKASLQYLWQIGDMTKTGRSTSWYLEDGIYNSSLIVSDDDGGWNYQPFVTVIEDKSPIVRLVDYTIYGNTTTSINIASSVTASYFDMQDLRYCVAGPSELVGSVDECSFVEVNSQHFYTNFTLQSLSSGNYQVITKIKNGNELGLTQYESELSVTQDTDGDELHDELEIMAGTSFNSTETDGDFIADPFETAIYLEGEYAQYAEYTKLFFGTDPTEFDTDGDQLPDGYFNGYGELISGTDPLDNDTDDDGLLDGIEVIGWEVTVETEASVSTFTVRSNPLVIDTDGDGLTDAEEYGLRSNPLTNDTDGDGLDDRRERNIGTSLNNDDTDDDGLLDMTEVNGYEMTWYDRDRVAHNTTVYSDPWRNDTDEDGLTDGEEFEANTDATSKDTDQDGLTDLEELSLTRPTVPYKAHTDGDDLFDGQEVKGWNVTVYTVSGAKYNEYGNVTLIEPTFGSTTTLIQTDPWNVDSDGDLILDHLELMPNVDTSRSSNSTYLASDPTKIDSDGDGIPDEHDPIPLMTDFEPPQIDGELSLEYNVPLLSYVEDVIRTVTGVLSDIASIINNSPQILSDIWTLIASSAPSFNNLGSKIDNYVKNLITSEESAANSSRDYLGDSVNLINFNPSVTPITSWADETIDFAYNIISGSISLSEAWNRVKDDLLNAISVIADYVKELADSWAENTWLSNNDDEYRKDGSSWITFETPGITIDWKKCGKIIKVICGIDDITTSGGFKLNVEKISYDGLLSLSLGGSNGGYEIDFVEGISDIFGVLAPVITLEFDVYDPQGIDKVELWVNADPASDAPTYTQDFNDATRGHFQWSEVFDLTNGCQPPEEDNGGTQPPDDNDPPDRPPTPPRVIVRSQQSFTETSGSTGTLSTSDTSTLSTSDSCDEDWINGATYTIILTDSDGNQRELTREKEGFAVSLANQANELFNFVLDAITEAVSWIIDEVTGLFQQGQQVFNDFVEDVEEGIERGLKIIEDAVIDTFLSKIGNILSGIFYPARAIQNTFRTILKGTLIQSSNLITDFSGDDVSISDEEIDTLNTSIGNELGGLNTIENVQNEFGLDLSSIGILQELTDFIPIDEASEVLIGGLKNILIEQLIDLISEFSDEEVNTLVEQLGINDWVSANEDILPTDLEVSDIEEGETFSDYLNQLSEINNDSSDISSQTELINSLISSIFTNAGNLVESGENEMFNSLITKLGNFLGGLLFIIDPSFKNSDLADLEIISQETENLGVALDDHSFADRDEMAAVWLFGNLATSVFEAGAELMRAAALGLAPQTALVSLAFGGAIGLILDGVSIVVSLVTTIVVSLVTRSFVNNHIYSVVDNDRFGYMLLVFELQLAAQFGAVFQDLGLLIGGLLNPAAGASFAALGWGIQYAVNLKFALQALDGFTTYRGLDDDVKFGFLAWLLQAFSTGLIDEMILGIGIPSPLDIILDSALIGFMTKNFLDNVGFSNL